MSPPDAPRPGTLASPPFAADRVADLAVARGGLLGALAWAFVASTVHRIQRSEGALLAINFSLIAHHGTDPIAQAVVSVLAMLVMYAFNDWHDAPTDWQNPKKDRRLIATYREHRTVAAVAIFGLKILTLALALATLGAAATAAAAAVMFVNIVYSTMLKGVPVVDVVWCGVWGALYAAIVGASPALLAVVGLMTAVCHLYQALDDRDPDAAAGITTTAVQSRSLSAGTFAALGLCLFLIVRAPLGSLWALTAFAPLGLFFATATARRGWVLTKVYFGVLWLTLLWWPGASL